MQHKIVLVDGMSIVFRSFYAMQNMYNLDNKPIGAVYGFINQILNLVNLYQTKHVIVALDCKEKTWRHHIHPAYKAHRKATPAELIPQFQLVRDACEAMGLWCYEGQQHEADDWIASCVHSYSAQGKIYIVSTDKDLLQLVSENTVVYHPYQQLEIDIQGVIAKWGVHPSQIVDLLALAGDVVDGITGIRGIGPKTAAKWLNEYANLEDIIHNAQKLLPNGKRNLVLAESHTLTHSKDLVMLRKSLTVNALDEVVMKPCRVRIRNFMQDQQLPLAQKAYRVLGI